MSSATNDISLLFIVILLRNHFPDVPLVIRNGSGPIDLSCIYNVKEHENGLVVKWYHNTDQIYQWIPPMPPQDVGVISGFAEYPEEYLRHPNSRSIIRLKMATLEMRGDYTCAISTFQEEDARRTRMTVYEPESNATIHVSSFNESHMNVTCVVNGAQPRPMLKIYVEGMEVNNYYDKSVKIIGYQDTFSTKRSAIMSNALEPLLLECEISIPYTDYKRREKIVYYPTQMLSQTSGASRNRDRAIGIIVLFCIREVLRK
ncbi:uncharacterized protein LOC108623792 isoform X2 [Ceratina calcarata]|uniref:Uncharacterized protein LOC108623792 isoform X2 n=1 Tax=Ceratina calcarata TaxID=156304 RepID=A0AAJ7IW93_9HYME|nr:uncharacterized protein LOC108623792 isoform X2 [Ceratina calcarata]